MSDGKTEESKEVAANKARIVENKKKLVLVDHAISQNAAQFLLTRASIQENRDLISRNYDAAFHGNFSVALGNLESIYRNRLTFLRNLKVDGPVQTNWKDAAVNQARIELLDVRSRANARVIGVSGKMAKVNTHLLELNSEIMAINQDIVDWNTRELAANTAMFDKKVPAALAAATPESNATTIAANAAKLEELKARAEENQKKDEEVRGVSRGNRERIETNTKLIYERRALIKKNMELINSNIAKLLSTF